ncbi:MAG: transcriptional repressor [Candidatus Zixiibacteriota bacterium]|nr:MAG: transcriptional repressor [candidate division Zixibacteria bacterium]
MIINTDKREHLTDKLKRNTPQRQTILAELRKLSSHPTAAELYQVVRERLPKISLGTVYRNLEFLNKNNIIQKLERGRSKARYDGNMASHYHVRCMHCGQLDDMCESPAYTVAATPCSLNSYKIISHRIEFDGICPRCQGTS